MKRSNQGPSARARPAGRRLRILVVEDHPDMRRGLEVFLEALGHWPQFARTLTGAVALAGTCKTFDLLLSGVHLSDGDGWELPCLLKRSGHCPPHAIAMSGFDCLGDAEKTLAAGFRTLLLTPGPPGELEAAVNAVAAL